MKYCKFCGSLIEEEAVLCPFCKKVLTPNYNLTIKMEDQFVIGKVVFNFCIDGGKSYTISKADTINITLPAGQHHLYIKYYWHKKSVNINLQSDMTFILSWDNLTGGILVHRQLN